MHARSRLLAGSILALSLGVVQSARADEGAPLERATLLAAVVRAHPGIRSSEHRAAGQLHAGEAEGSLPPPDAMMQVWQVPIAKPYAVGDAQMIMFGVAQSFPAPGARGARQRAAEDEALAERAMGADRVRQLRRDANHAFADYVEATARHRVHVEHRRSLMRTMELARARHAGGGSLGDAAEADVELARMDADVITDGTRVEAARGRINALLGRGALLPLGPPVISEPETTGWDASTALAKAREHRPELRASIAQREARREEMHAAKKEAVIPSFSVAALYFAPTTPMPHHGYGMNASVSLPWLWGAAGARHEARRDFASAAESDVLAMQRVIEAEVATQEANVRANALRLLALRDRALPAGRRAFEVARAGYEASRIEVLRVLSAERAITDVEGEIVASRAALDHALADLEAAVGTDLPRRKLAPSDPAEEGAGRHVR